MSSARAFLLAPLALLAAAAAGCGEEEAASAPGDLVPEGAPIYLELSLESEEQTANAEALIGELGEVPLLGSALDPEELIASELEKSAREEGAEFSYAEDVEPWLGDRIALAFLSFAGFEENESVAVAATTQDDTEPEDFVFIFETTDEEIARESLLRVISSDPDVEEVEETEIAGEPALVEAEGAAAFADGFVVAGPRPEVVEQALEARDGEALPDSDVFADAQAGLPGERLGFGFVDVGAAMAYAAETGGVSGQEAALLDRFYGDFFSAPASFAVTAGERGAAVDVATGSPPFSIGVQASELVAEAPADALGAVGLGDLGAQAEQLLSMLEDEPELFGIPDPAAIGAQFEAATGVALDEATGSLGEGSFWVRGRPPEDYAFGFELEVDGESEAPAALLGFLGDGVRSEGFTVELLAGGQGFSARRAGPVPRADVGFVNAAIEGDRATIVAASDETLARGPEDGTIADSEGLARARDALGEFELSAYADLGPVLDLVLEDRSAFDVVTGEASAEEAVVGYLADKLGFAAIGMREEGERLIQRFAVGLR